MYYGIKMKVGKVIACILAFFMLAIPASSFEKVDAQNAEMPSDIVISIEGGFGMTITIRNTSGGPLPGTEWSVELKGLIFYGGSSSGTIGPSASEITIRILPVGIGPGIITISVGNESASTAAFFMAGPFIVLV